MKKRIAIAGAGFAGLAAAYFLSRARPQALITLFEPLPIHQRTSGLAAGLLHPYAGKQAKLNRWGGEGMEAARELLAVSNRALGKEVGKQTGMLRVPASEQQCLEFKERAGQDARVEWWEAERCQREVPGIVQAPGLWIPEAMQIDCPLYLEGLELACLQQGVQWIREPLLTEEQWGPFDLVIGALGASICRLAPFAQLPIRPIKGQILEWEWPPDLPPLPFGLNAQAYLLMTSQTTCLSGATFEKNFSDAKPDAIAAEKELRSKVEWLFPPLRNAMISGCRAGLRASAPGHQPIVGHVQGKFWALTGFGSKGLLYHALFAKKLCSLLKGIF